jgi:hypothetical protein
VTRPEAIEARDTNMYFKISPLSDQITDGNDEAIDAIRIEIPAPRVP